MDHQLTKMQIGLGVLMSCGARDFVADTNALMFRVGSKRGVIAKIIVTLDPSDTYSVRYVEMRTRGYEITTDETVSDVYAENLAAIVRDMGDR